VSRPSFEYPDENGTVLGVEPGPGPAGDMAAVSVADMTCYVLAEHRAQVAAGLWTGSGAPAPVILDRPEGIDAALSRPDGTFSAGSYAFAVHDGRIDMTGPVHCMLAEEAEFVAGALAVYAAIVRRDEPDPAEVAELAEVIVTTDPRSRGYSPDPEVIARAVLRWIKDRQQRGEER
jgi:hypothetical protein